MRRSLQYRLAATLLAIYLATAFGLLLYINYVDDSKDAGSLEVQKLLSGNHVGDKDEKSDSYKQIDDFFRMYRKERIDTRPKSCHHRAYDVSDKFSKKVSIVILARDETYDWIYREIASILSRTEYRYLLEIVVFFHGEQNPLQDISIGEIIESTQKIDVYFLHENIQIHRARNSAIKHCRGEVVVVLHGHLEVLTKWLEPLLCELDDNPERIAVMAGDEIDHLNLEQIEHIPWHLVGVPSWSLTDNHVHEIHTAERQRRTQSDPFPDSSPIRSALFLWPLFACWRKFYNQIEGYDESLDARYSPSGEDVDFAIRVWLSGGSIFVIPCSKFAQSNHNPSFINQTAQEEERNRNSYKIANKFNLSNHEMFIMWKNTIGKYDRSQVNPSAKSFKYPFEWFIENLVPEMWKKRDIAALGTIRNAETNLCIDNFDGMIPKLYPCHGKESQVYVMLRTRKQIQNIVRKCLRPDIEGQTLGELAYCNDELVEENTRWSYNNMSGELFNEYQKKCLDIGNQPNIGSTILLTDCAQTTTQKWKFGGI